MENNANTADLRAAILPDLAAFSDNTKQLWRPEIQDAKLREAMFSDPHLNAHLYNDLLSEFGLTGASDPTPSYAQDLEYLLHADAQNIASRAGLVRYANELARRVSSGKLDFSSAGWAVDDLRFALSLRAHSIDADIGEASFASTVHTAGQNCLSAWLNTLPTDILRALEISVSPLGAALRRFHVSDVDAGIFAICLTAVREQS